MIYTFGDSSSQRAKLRYDLKAFASSWPDLTIVIGDPLDFPDLLAKLGLEAQQKAATYPVGAVHQLTTGKIWPYPAGKAFDKKSLQQWGMDVWQGKITPLNARVKSKDDHNGRLKRKTAKSNRQVKLSNVPGMEKLREKLERRDEL